MPAGTGSRGRRRAGPALLALVAAAAGLAWLALWSGRGGGDAVTAIDPTSGAADDGAGVTTASVTEAARPRSSLAGSASVAEGGAAGAAPAGDGVLTIRVSEADGRPARHLDLQVFCERGGLRRLARTATDEEGEAAVEGLTEDLYLVETARRVPYAPALAVVWLPAGGHETVEVRLGGGGRIEGRVVDDRGEPVAGAEIVLHAVGLGLRAFEAGEREVSEVVASSAADGTYVVEAVRSRAWGVWLVDGETRPERWEALVVRARLGGVSAVAEIHVDLGETARAPDLVLPRPTTRRGVVLDASERAVAGARVRVAGTQRLDRPPRDGAPVVTTDAAGRFELTDNARLGVLIVVTAEGYRQAFAVGSGTPGETIDDLRLVLEPWTQLVLEVVDPNGRAVPSDEHHLRRPRSLYTGGHYRQLFGKAAVIAHLHDGRALRSLAATDEDRRLRPTWPVGPETLRSIEVFVEGYRPATHAFDLPPRIGEELRLSLVPGPVVAVRIVPDPEWEPPEEGAPVWLLASVVSPAQAETAETAGTSSAGLGAQAFLKLAGGPIDVDLVTRTDEPCWVYLTHPARRSFGPFRPGGPRAEIRLDAALFEGANRPAAGPPVAEEPATPPDASRPGDDEERGRLVVRAVDARDGEPLGHFSVAVGRSAEEVTGNGGLWHGGRNGRAVAELLPGTWSLVVRAEGYRASATRTVTVAVGEESDSGTVALEPHPELRGRILQADGSPVTAPFEALLLDAEAKESFSARLALDGEGRFRLRAELPPRLRLRVTGSADGHTALPAFQAVDVDAWPPHEDGVLRLAPWRAVRIRLTGMDPVHGESRLSVRASPVRTGADRDSEHPRFGVWWRAGSALREVDERDASARAFAFLAGPGTYDLVFDSALYAFDEREVDVAAGEGPLVLELDAR